MSDEGSILDEAVKLIGSLDRERENILKRYSDLRPDIRGSTRGLRRRTHDKNVEEVEILSSRINYLRNIILKQINLSRSEPSKKVFLSFSVRGRELASELGKKIENRFGREKITVTTGFDRDYNSNKMNAIIAAIAAAECFIGVWTAEFGMPPQEIAEAKVRKRPTKRRGSVQPHGYPSPWMPLELGIALSFYKPFVLIVDRQIERDFVFKVAADIPHEFVKVGELLGPGGTLAPPGIKLADRVVASALFRMHVGSKIEDYVYYDFFRN